MSVIYKFSKRVILIESKDTQTAKKQAYVFLARPDHINQSLPGELIINRNTKSLSKFRIVLFKKLEVKLFYSKAYHPQIDRSSKKTNQTVEIALQFFVYALNKPGLWSQVMPYIQAIINNTTSCSTGKTSNKVAYSFSLHHSLNPLTIFSTPEAFTDIAKAVSFVLLNQKLIYNHKHPPLFIKVRVQAILQLHKRYSILATARITKKLTQQYVGPFCTVQKVGCLAYRLDVSHNWEIHLVISVAQLKLTPPPVEDPFARLFPFNPPLVFVKHNTDKLKSFKIERLLNKYQVNKGKGYAIEYLVHRKGYGLE